MDAYTALVVVRHGQQGAWVLLPSSLSSRSAGSLRLTSVSAALGSHYTRLGVDLSWNTISTTMQCHLAGSN